MDHLRGSHRRRRVANLRPFCPGVPGGIRLSMAVRGLNVARRRADRLPLRRITGPGIGGEAQPGRGRSPDRAEDQVE